MFSWLKLKVNLEQYLDVNEVTWKAKIRNPIRKIFLKELKKVIIVTNQVYENIKVKEEEMAKQARIEDILIPIFDGANYTSWKIRLMILLEYKECKDPAIREMTEEEKRDEAKWKKIDLKARTIIISSISDKQLEYVGECATALEMIQKFDKMYISQSTALQIICRSKIEEIKLNNHKTVEDFFMEFEKVTNEFKSAGGRLEETEKLRYLIRALPPSYSYIGDFIDVIPEDQRTVDYVKSKIKEKNMTQPESENKTNVSTFVVQTKGKCYTCGEPGHHSRQCTRPQQQSNRGRGAQSSQGQRDQQRGNQRGYNRGYNRGLNRGNYRGRQRGRGQGQPRGEPLGEQQGDYTSEAWLTQVCNSEVNQVTAIERSSENLGQMNWILDSGCTDHIVNNDKFFDKFIWLKEPVEVKLPDGKNLKATKIGTIRLLFKNYYNEKQVEVKNVYYVQGIRQNILSLSKVTENYTVVAKIDDAKIYNKHRELIAVAYKKDNLYFMKSFVIRKDSKQMYVNSIKLTDKEKWHRALGHINFQYLNKLVKNKLVEGLPEKIENTEMKCANCIESKMSNVPFENNRSKATEILELIHTDLNGPHNTIGYGGEKYFLTFVDDYSKCTRIFCIKNKSETANCLKEFVNLVENEFNKKVKKLQCDNGKKYLNREIYDFVESKGIELVTYHRTSMN